MAFIPACKREREAAASHVVAGEGISPMGVDVDSITGVAVGETVGEGGESPSTDSIAPVGDGGRAEVDSTAGLAVAVGEESGAAVVADSLGAAGDSFGLRVDVSERVGKLVGIVVEFAVGVAEELEETNVVGGNSVEAGAKASGVVLLRRKRKRTNRMIATINLKRS